MFKAMVMQALDWKPCNTESIVGVWVASNSRTVGEDSNAGIKVVWEGFFMLRPAAQSVAVRPILQRQLRAVVSSLPEPQWCSGCCMFSGESRVGTGI
jgi:hypothetical protein